MQINITMKRPHATQARFIDSPAKRKVKKAGRREGKTVGVSIIAERAILAGLRVLYATPTQEQIDAFWTEVTETLMPLILSGHMEKNETRHLLSFGKGRIRAKTAWDADTLRGDTADILILDEFQLMKEDAWKRVGAPMMLDTDGTAIFCFTPPSIRSAAKSKAKDPRHAIQLFKRAKADTTGRWEAFEGTSMDNPHLSQSALADIINDMDDEIAYRQEILGEDVEESGGVFNRSDFAIVDDIPEITHRVRHWDLAGTADGGDYTVGLLLGLGIDGALYVEDVQRDQLDPHDVEKLMVDTAKRDGQDVQISLNQDPGQAGKAQAKHLIQLLRGYDVHTQIETGSKQVRAIPVAAQAKGGNVRLKRAHWNDDFLDEIELFPIGYYDDQVDSLSGAFEDIPAETGSMILWSA